jgi:DNA ligase (NAD+)
LPYETDGVVIKVNHFQYQDELGYRKIPRWAMAYKFKSEQVFKLNSITYQVGRTGAITPVANLDPVQLAGTIVKELYIMQTKSNLLIQYCGVQVFVVER